ncbi:hypothetical protein MFIFM68171_08336 [Madurella fahalii]|uniref:SSCRP protein n=1 Tax=Madurella fahalii TaxID=1157608 RepID=A0ABQ0GK78_9PEZI
MKYLALLASALGLAAASVIPLEQRDVQTVHLKFRAGPAEYDMAFPADGAERLTNSNLAVNIIEAPDYNAYSQCDFRTVDGAEVTFASSISPDGIGLVLVGPPQPIVAVSCQGMCVPNYSNCYENGQLVGPCCNGYCAANKCRPWNGV